jgi:hypothetical protein
MALGGAFNVSRLIRELGLKSIRGDELRVLDTIQPTMSVADLEDWTPAHVGPSVIFGIQPTSGAGTRGIVEIQALSAGGAYVDWIGIFGTLNCEMRVIPNGSGLTNAVPPAAFTSRDPIVSVCNQGPIAATGAAFVQLNRNMQTIRFDRSRLFVPRGSFFQIELTPDNSTMSIGFAWREVVASPSEP